jgi:hypothetical protein
MASYQITCATKVHAHRHITTVGGPVLGSAGVEQARALIASGDTLYTVSPSTGQRATVERFDCPSDGVHSLRSSADATGDNNLDDLPSCS